MVNEVEAETFGNTGKSSCEIVFIDAFARSVLTTNTSPFKLAEIFLLRALLKNPYNTAPGTATTPPAETFAGSETSTPYSKFVARSTSWFPSAVIKILPNTGKFGRRSTNRAAIAVAERSCSALHSNFILFIKTYYY
jgi:hypothetical protein